MPLGFDRSLFVRSGILLLLSVVGGSLLHSLRTDRVSLAAPHQGPLTCSAPVSSATAGFVPEEIDPAEVLPLCNRAGVVLADARSAALFASGHVAGSLHVPCMAGPLSAEKKAALAEAKTVVVIGESTSAARTAGEALRSYVPEARLRILRGGFSAWESAGFACVSGPCEDCVSSTAVRSAP